MTKTYNEYLSLKIEGKTLEEIVLLARSEHEVSVNTNNGVSNLYWGPWIPFNLEREYVDELIDSRQYEKAKQILNRMRHSYTPTAFQNFIESYEYHLKSILQSEEIIRNSIIEAKREFNQHTITLVSVIVGMITIFGSANIVITNHSYFEMMTTFGAVVLSVLSIVVITTILNKGLSKKR